MLPQTAFWICRGLALLLLGLGIVLGILKDTRRVFALLFGLVAAFLFQYMLLPLVNGLVEGLLVSLAPETMHPWALPLALLVITAVYEMLVFTLCALPVKDAISAPLAWSFALGYWGFTVIYLFIGDLSTLLGSQSIIFPGTALETLCSAISPALHLPLYCVLALSGAALVSGAGFDLFWKGILWNLVHRLILALPALLGTEIPLAVLLDGFWGLLLLVFSIRAARRILSFETGEALIMEDPMAEEAAGEDAPEEVKEEKEGEAVATEKPDEEEMPEE